MRYAVALVAAVGAAAVAPAAHAVSHHPAARTTASSAASSSASGATRVTLPTGDTVVVRPTSGGRSSYATLAADPSGITGSFASVAVGGDQYVLPGEVQPLLGSLVDPSLFDVTTLTRSAGPGTVTATVTSTSARVPGLTVTGRTATTVTGYVGASGAAAFRAALVSAATDVSAGREPMSFPGVTRLSGAAPAGAVTPDYPQVTLKISVTAGADQPAPSGFLVLVNVDDARRYNSFIFFRRGQARVSVPLGHYSGLADSFQIAPDGNSAVSVDVPISDYTVRDDQQTMTFDLSTATVSPSLTTPRPAQVDEEGITWIRSDASGHGSTGFSDSAGGGVDLRWAPAPPAQYGEEDWITSFHADGGTTAAPPAQYGEEDWITSFHADGGTTAAPYTYDLSFATRGYVPSDGDHDVTDADLATLDASYYMDKRSQSAFGLGAYYPFVSFVFTTLLPLQTPAEVTEYVNDDPDVYWGGAFIGKARAFGDLVDEFGGRHYAAGTTTPIDWLRGPLAPAPAEDAPGGPDFVGCSACRTAKKVEIFLAPYTDTEQGHIGESVSGDPSALRATLSVDGRRIAASRGYLGLLARVSPDPHSYALHVRADRSADQDSLSTSSVTDYGFTSSATTGVPWRSDGYCYLSPDPSSCRTVGLLEVTAPLPTDLLRRVPVGTSTFPMTIAPYGGATTGQIEAGVSVSVDGRTFVPQAVYRIDAQHFQVRLATPAAWAGKPVTFRVSAADADGDTITQTTTAAYAVAGD